MSNTTIQVRRQSSAAFTVENPVLARGEPGLETDTKKVKYGDGTTAWNDLPYAGAASSHSHGNITNSGAIGSTANLPVITSSSGVLTTGSFGNSSNTFCAGNDSRLSDSRTPTSHTHGNITNAGAIGSTSTLPIITTTGGVLTTGSFSTTAGTFCQGNDSRLSDARNPLATCSSVAHGNSGSSRTLSATGAVQTCSLTANCTFTMPAATASDFVLILTQTGSFTATFTNVRWPGNVAPTITTGANKIEIIRFVSNGTNWYGQITQNYNV